MAFMDLSGQEQGYDVLQPLINAANGGSTSWLSYTGIDDDTNPALAVQNSGSGGALTVKASGGSSLLTAADSGVTIPTLSVTTLTATTANITTLNVSGNTTLGDAAGDTITLTGATTANGTFSTTSTTNLGNGNADAITVTGLTAFKNAAATATQLYVDAGNDRVLIGAGTALTGATSSKLEVTGRVYLTPTAASEDLLTLWRSPSAGSGWTIGVTTTPNGLLKFKDDGDQGIITFGDTSSTYQIEVTGDGHVTDDFYVDGDVTGSRMAVGATTWSGAEELRVVGETRLEGALTVTTGGADITGVSVIETYTARVYKGSAQSISDSSVTAITFDTERWDNGSLHSTSSNTDRLVGPVAGKYLITAHVQFASNATGERQLRVHDSSGNVLAMHSQAPISGNVTRMSIATVVELTASDYVTINVYQSSGGALDVASASRNSPEATITKIA